MMIFPKTGCSRATFVYVDERRPSNEVMCDAIHRLPLESGGLRHVKGPATAHSNLELCDPTAPGTAPPNLEFREPEGSEC